MHLYDPARCRTLVYDAHPPLKAGDTVEREWSVVTITRERSKRPA